MAPDELPFIVSGWSNLGDDRRVCVQPRPVPRPNFVAGHDGLWLSLTEARTLRDMLENIIIKLEAKTS